jgi:hypothetical protein
MPASLHAVAAPAGTALLAAVLLLGGSGCASTRLEDARSQYRRGDYPAAAASMAEMTFPKTDRVLYGMERGTIRQAVGDFEGSTRDYLDAYDTLDALAAISVSRDTASMVINDNVQTFRGAPFERTLLHSFTAKNHLLRGDAELAAVEARRIIQSLDPDKIGDYPADAYSRYLAGFCLGLIGDPSNAALQYRRAAELAPHLTIDDRTGRIAPAGQSPTPPGSTHELVVFVLAGRSPTGQELHTQRRSLQPPGYAEVVINGTTAGRSHTLADTMELAFTTRDKDAIRDAAKTLARIAAKEATAHQLDKENELVGALFRIIMIGLLEQPDIRRWETLPRSLQVARVDCPPDPAAVDIQFRSIAGAPLRTLPLAAPLVRIGNTYLAVVRDNQPVL